MWTPPLFGYSTSTLRHACLQTSARIPIRVLCKTRMTGWWKSRRWCRARRSGAGGRTSCSRILRNCLSMGSGGPCLERICCTRSSGDSVLAWTHYTSGSSAASYSHYRPGGSPRTLGPAPDLSSWSGRTTRGAWRIVHCRISVIRWLLDPLYQNMND